ncbi:MAG: hypothetical protein ISN26_02085 [Betaproteobacteria bacterium AqS2]|uniref:Uncharacterized protein n=1 Tax=Candidatus Amphirhobacter heronislandensis TaxID=1732024 RepID=A0A930UBI1_9GAMM|nr:hypothetical protein [Betaproteobacteria bacterium AqS2]
MSPAEFLAAIKPVWLLPFLFVVLAAVVWIPYLLRKREPNPDEGAAEASEIDFEPEAYEVAPPLNYAPCKVYGVRCDNDCERDFVRCAFELAGDFAAVRRYDQGPIEYLHQGKERLYWPAFTVTHADGRVEHFEFKAADRPKEEAQRRRVHWCGVKEREAFTSRAAEQCLPLAQLQAAGHYQPGFHRAHEQG